jgi:sec-independent protein translocase protein TatC
MASRKKTALSARKKLSPDDKDAFERGDESLAFTGHLTELRSRLLTVLIAVMITTILPFFLWGEKMVRLMTMPYNKAVANHPLNVFSPMEGFLLQLKSSLIAGILVVFPLIVFEVWSYVKPAIDKDKRAFIRNTLVFAVLFFYAGTVLTFLWFAPFTIRSLLDFTPPNMTITLNASTYLHFMFFFCFSMGLVFELPLAIMILTKIGIVTPAFLSKKRKYAIVLIWIAAAVITPTTDILTQSLVAIPLMILYEVSIILSKIIVMRSRHRNEQ